MNIKNHIFDQRSIYWLAHVHALLWVHHKLICVCTTWNLIIGENCFSAFAVGMVKHTHTAQMITSSEIRLLNWIWKPNNLWWMDLIFVSLCNVWRFFFLLLLLRRLIYLIFVSCEFHISFNHFFHWLLFWICLCVFF